MKIQRLIAILTVLLQTERISATKLAEKFEVSVRTIYRDIETLEQAGIPIVTYAGADGGISIMESYKIDKKLFTSEDISTLLTSLQSISSSVSDPQLKYTLEKIKALIPTEQLSTIELSSKQLYIDMSPWAGNPLIEKNLSIIRCAIGESQLLSLDYGTREGSASHREIEPHQLILKENQWYVKAYCRKRMDFRTFKISRMTELTMLEEYFIPRAFKSGTEDFKSWTHEKMITVEILADQVLKERVLEHCREETIRDVGDGKILISLPFVESDMGYGVLMGMGAFAEVLKPTHVREELEKRLRETIEIYTKSE